MASSAFSGLRKIVAGGTPSRHWSAALRRLDGRRLLTGLAAVLNIVLVVLIADAAAAILWTWAQPSPGQAAIGQHSLATAGGQARDYRLLTTFDPFHRQPVARVEASEEAARETTLDLKLFGLRAGADDGDGSAIIRTPDKKQGAFRPGDQIMDGVTLERIRPDRVMISHRGVLENLFLDEKSRVLIAAAESRKTVTETKQNAPVSHGMTMDDADRLMAAIKAQPRLTGRGIEGLVLTPGTDAALFGELGFVAGDVLIAVNGSRLDSADRVENLAERLRTAQSIRLEIQRDGEMRTIEFSNE